MFFAERQKILQFTGKNRLPDITEWSEFPAAGGFMSYGASRRDLYRRAATYVDKILKGAKPADLPVEQPTRFELVITFPPAILIRADHVIQ
jgi:putative ABC transport system substrate-binding protein